MITDSTITRRFSFLAAQPWPLRLVLLLACRGLPSDDSGWPSSVPVLAWDVTQNQSYVKLYVDCESEDGYLRDGCIWREDINIYATMSAVVKYENGVFMNYTANTYLPFEGQAISINGRTGRLDYNEFGGGGFANKGLRLTRSFGKSEVIQDLEARRAGGHGGADTSLHDLIFRGSQSSDPLGLRADLRAGARSSLIGIAAYRSIERGSQTVRIKDLVKL